MRVLAKFYAYRKPKGRHLITFTLKIFVPEAWINLLSSPPLVLQGDSSLCGTVVFLTALLFRLTLMPSQSNSSADLIIQNYLSLIFMDLLVHHRSKV
jgi:hypothetical protein